MQHSFHPQLYQRSEHLAGRRGTWGNLLLSRQPLFEGAPLGGQRGGFGVWAISVVDGKKFYIACTRLAPGDAGKAEAAEFERLWKSRGSPPLIAAILDSDPHSAVHLDSLHRATKAGEEEFYLSGEWSLVNWGLAPGTGKGTVPVWIEVTRSDSTPAAILPAPPR